MTEEKNEYVKTKIKGRTETYYLVTENDLSNIRQNNIFGDIFFFIASLLIADFMSRNDNILLLILGLLFFGFSVYYYYVKYTAIKNIKESGEIKSLNTGEDKVMTKKDEPENALIILQATYGSPANNIDITSILNNLVSNGRLTTIASNNLAGDPHHGVIKSLNIKYKHNGLIITKEFKENEQVILP